LGVSSSSAGGRLRRGLRTLVGETLYDHPDTEDISVRSDSGL
jgi:hypothetical protein